MKSSGRCGVMNIPFSIMIVVFEKDRDEVNKGKIG